MRFGGLDVVSLAGEDDSCSMNADLAWSFVGLDQLNASIDRFIANRIVCRMKLC